MQQQCEMLCGLNPRTSLCDCSGAQVGPRPVALAVATASQAMEATTRNQVSQPAATVQRAPVAKSSIGEAVREPDGSNNVDDDPDWDIICFELCILGEGGLLCHCDLPPFLPRR